MGFCFRWRVCWRRSSGARLTNWNLNWVCLRGACADVAGAEVILAVALGLSASDLPRSPAHTGALFAVAATAFVLTEVFAARWLAWIGSLVGLVAVCHLTTYSLGVRPVTLAVLVALVWHAAASVVGAWAFAILAFLRFRGEREAAVSDTSRRPRGRWAVSTE